MNSLIIAGIGVVILVLAYRFYGQFLSKIFSIDETRKTPAVELYDGVDYVPAKHWVVLFGHHFASIAGAGPILGPVIACVTFGWLPALLWIIVGSIFIGAVHDFSALILSVRHRARSIGDIAEIVISRRVKIIFMIFLFISLTLVIAVFTAVTAETLVAQPEIVIPTFGLIFIAILVGIMMYRLKANLLFSTAIGLFLLFLLIMFGTKAPVSIVPGAPEIVFVWIVILLLYCFFAAIMPVNLLLQPRDYISAYLLLLCSLGGYIGLILTRPVITTPAIVHLTSQEGTIWPMLCVIIACGAISGFHSLVATGTTSKQLANEKDAKKIGYGGMLTEAAVSILAILSVCAGLYWTKGQGGLIYPELMKTKGWIVTFATGYAEITKPIFGHLGKMVAIFVLNAFVLTTLDTATRIARYIVTELLEQKIKIFTNRYFSTGVVILLALYLASGNWKTIWPVFGASNQLVGALVFLVITAYLFSKGISAKCATVPGLFLLITTITALVYKGIQFFLKGAYLLTVICAVLVIMAIFMLSETYSRYKHHITTQPLKN